VLKEHGNGGVIDLRNGGVVPLKLRAPHSVRKVNGEYWVFDSGNATLNIYTPEWTIKERIVTKGWGRGAAISHSLRLFYAGISAVRKRYLGLIGGGIKETPNMIQAFSIESRSLVGEIVIDHGIEQVSNIYLVERELALSLLELSR
jgi:hypothetical protein